MADTKTRRGYFQDEECSDCGEKGCDFQHWGDLIPAGKFGSFCWFCWTKRNEADDRGENPQPLGVQAPGIPAEFLTKEIKVTTKSGTIYKLALTDKEEERFISCDERQIHFRKARVICLAMGQSLFLRPRDGNSSDLWWTAPVVLIEAIE